MQLTINQQVINFGVAATVIGFASDGSPILYNVRLGKWIADASKCTPRN